MSIPQRNPIKSARPSGTIALPIGRFLASTLLALCAAFPAFAQPTRIEAEMLDGSRYSLADSRGSVTLISIWSPESLASRKCIWELQRFAAMYDSRGVRTIAISTLQDRDELRAFLKSRKLSLPVAVLGANDLGEFKEFALPVVYVFDREGKLQATREGLFSLRTLERLVAPQMQDR